MAEKRSADPKKAEANRAAKKAAAKAATPGAKPAKPAVGQKPTGAPGTARVPDPYKIVLHPVVTEKTMFNMDKNNALEFIVAPRATKPEIAAAIETLFTVKVHKVTTRVTREGKRAVVRFAVGFSAEDIGTRIGVF